MEQIRTSNLAFMCDARMRSMLMLVGACTLFVLEYLSLQ